MIKLVRVTNPKGETLELELVNPEKSGLVVARIEGLGPPQANINGQEMATTDGMIYSSARASTRNVVFTLYMYERDRNSDYGRLSIEQSRHLVYRYFPLKKEIKMEFVTDTRTIYCKGYIETCTPNIFERTENVQVSVICPDPYLYEEGNSVMIFSGTRPSFEFPFSNESLTEKLIKFGDIWVNSWATLEYEGTVDTGLLITIHAFDDAKNIRIYNVDTRERITINTDVIEQVTGSPYAGKDDIVIHTKVGERYCRLLRDGVYTNIIGALSRDTDWLQISNGSNVFTFTADEGEENLSVSFRYENAYVGV